MHIYLYVRLMLAPCGWTNCPYTLYLLLFLAPLPFTRWWAYGNFSYKEKLYFWQTVFLHYFLTFFSIKKNTHAQEPIQHLALLFAAVFHRAFLSQRMYNSTVTPKKYVWTLTLRTRLWLDGRMRVDPTLFTLAYWTQLNTPGSMAETIRMNMFKREKYYFENSEHFFYRFYYVNCASRIRILPIVYTHFHCIALSCITNVKKVS